MSKPLLSVIIPAFNAEIYIEKCLQPLIKNLSDGLEVIVVDNGSVDKTAAIVTEGYPQVTLLKNQENLGACRARNQAIEVSSGEWVLTLDCDVVLEDDFILKVSQLIDDLPSDRIGIIQPKILQADKKTIDSCGIHLSWLRRFYDLGKGKTDSGQFNESIYVFGACSACALYRRTMLEDLKESGEYFDQKFFFLVEDVDLAWRANNRQWQSFFFPFISCCHIGKSSGFPKKFRQYLCFRNRYYTIAKNEGLGRYAGKILPVIIYDFPRLVYLALTNKYFWTRKL
ncbi:MAG: glycosyltransferase family 2 protein [Candidatus Omnitrophica bacterium]|nr:glycosyltransferase family 2 protein [Candidatus Omnitrophota bacterium]